MWCKERKPNHKHSQALFVSEMNQRCLPNLKICHLFRHCARTKVTTFHIRESWARTGLPQNFGWPASGSDASFQMLLPSLNHGDSLGKRFAGFTLHFAARGNLFMQPQNNSLKEEKKKKTNNGNTDTTFTVTAWSAATIILLQKVTPTLLSLASIPCILPWSNWLI